MRRPFDDAGIYGGEGGPPSRGFSRHEAGVSQMGYVFGGVSPFARFQSA